MWLFRFKAPYPQVCMFGRVNKREIVLRLNTHGLLRFQSVNFYAGVFSKPTQAYKLFGQQVIESVLHEDRNLLLLQTPKTLVEIECENLEHFRFTEDSWGPFPEYARGRSA